MLKVPAKSANKRFKLGSALRGLIGLNRLVVISVNSAIKNPKSNNTMHEQLVEKLNMTSY